MPISKKNRGFTIIELMVVVAAIAILMGVLLVGIQSASRLSKNVVSMSRLKQLHIGWTTYANAYEDRLLPGYIDEDVQSAWRVRYRTPDGERVDPAQCKTYPWRLLPYLDYDLDTLYGYSSQLEQIKNNYGSQQSPGYIQSQQLIADTPAFGYNAYYVGGWWEARGSGDDVRSHLVFGNSAAEIKVGDDIRMAKGRLVSRTMGQIANPSQLIAFCASVNRNPGVYMRQEDNPIGASWVVPQRLCTEQVWTEYGGDSRASIGGAVIPRQSGGEGMEVFVQQAVPLRRHGISVPLLNCDGSTEQTMLNDLLSMDRWTSAAIQASVRPSLFEHECDDTSGNP
jgi:prepilin-type N-terminal cleavage/methylation domain-containing protein